MFFTLLQAWSLHPAFKGTENMLYFSPQTINFIKLNRDRRSYDIFKDRLLRFFRSLEESSDIEWADVSVNSCSQQKDERDVTIHGPRKHEWSGRGGTVSGLLKIQSFGINLVDVGGEGEAFHECRRWFRFRASHWLGSPCVLHEAKANVVFFFHELFICNYRTSCGVKLHFSL